MIYYKPLLPFMAKASAQAKRCEIRLLHAYKTIAAYCYIASKMMDHIPQQSHETSAHNVCSCSHKEAACHRAHEDSWLNNDLVGLFDSPGGESFIKINSR